MEYLQTTKNFITKNSNSSLKIVRVVVNNTRQVKTFTRIMMANNLWDYSCRGSYNFLLFYFLEHLNIWGSLIIKTIILQIDFKVNAMVILTNFSTFENFLKLYFIVKKFDSRFFFSVLNFDPIDSPLLLWIIFFLIPVRTSVIHSSEITDFPKKLMDKNLVKNGYFFKNPL